MFKVGQKVVYIGQHMYHDSDCIIPGKHEIITIHGKCSVHDGCYDICEYLLGKSGAPQSFMGSFLRPLDETFADEVLERVKEEINKEELVLI